MGRAVVIVFASFGVFAGTARAGGALGAEAGVHLAYGSTGGDTAGGPRVGMMAGASFGLGASRLMFAGPGLADLSGVLLGGGLGLAATAASIHHERWRFAHASATVLGGAG